jgi:hypothetical protein
VPGKGTDSPNGPSRRSSLFEGGDAFGLRVAGSLFLSEQGGEVLKLGFESGLSLFAVAQSGFEFVFA